MSSVINNIFSKINNLTNSTASNQNVSQYKVPKKFLDSSPALHQGEKFKYYQHKIVKNLEKRIQNVNSKEGFQNGSPELNANSLTNKTNTVLNKNDYSSQKETVNNLKQEYQNTINEYENLVKKIKSSTTNYLDRVNPSNPYLGKNVCLSNGACGYVTQKGVFKLYPNENIFNTTAGQNGCPKTAYMAINGDGDVNTVGSTISSNPPLIVGTPMVSGQSCGNEGSDVLVDKLISDPTISYMGCYADNSTTPLLSFLGGSPGANSTAGSYTYDQCKDAAINGGYRYFALQGVDYSTSKGYCAASNNQKIATSLGNSYIINGQTSLWSSGTTGDNQGSVAMLNGDGTLVVNNSSGTAIFTTPVPENVKSQPNPYIGCYKLDNDSKDNEIANRYTLTFEQCQDLATNKGYQYFGVGGNNRGTNVKRCLGYNDLDTAKSDGLSQKCKNQTTGGSGAASIYATDNLSTLGNSYLILQDDGNMCIYNGTGPDNNQGLIWSSGTNGKQQDPNPLFAAINGKYGKNWVASGSTFAVGDFIGSTNGNIALIMQSDGNLVLNTFTQTTNCKKMADGNYGAGTGGNALYDIGKSGNLSNLSKVAYVDQDATLHPYPQNKNLVMNNINNKQIVKENFDTVSDTIPDVNDRRDMQDSTNMDVANIDSNTYDNYNYTDNPRNNDGLKNATAVQRQLLLQLQNKMNLLSSQLSSYTGNYNIGVQELQSQSKANIAGMHNYLNEIKNVNHKIYNFDTNVKNILNDSDINVLQKNYNYLFWTILATGTVLVAMNIIKK